MSINTISGNNDLVAADPDSFLDAKTSAIVSVAGQEGISGWVFDIPTGETVDLETDVTDHYIENGSFISDHAVNKPVRITLTGIIGELVYEIPKDGLEANLSALSNTLTAVNAFAPELNPQAAQSVAAAAQVAAYAASQYEAIQKRLSNLKKYFSGDDATQTLQQKAFAELNAMRESKQIVSVQTPWAFYNAMIITSISARQDDKSNDKTDFSITLKEMRFADIKVTEFDANQYKSDVDVQSSAQTDNGTVQGKLRSSVKAVYNKAAGIPND